MMLEKTERLKKQCRRKTRRTTAARMDGKRCVITGATSGIGLAAARRLAQGGANLVLVARNRAKAEAVRAELTAAHGVEVDIAVADFCRLSDVRGAAETIRSRYPVIDALINCAGLFSTRKRMTPDGNEMTFQVNHLAGFLLTMLLLGPIAKSPQGRILQVNSMGHRFGGLRLDDLNWQSRVYLWPRAYGASKLAQLMTAYTLSKKLQGTSVTINAIHPGTVGTNIVQNSGHLLQWLMHHFKRYILKNPAVSGEAIYYLTAAPELQGVSGEYFILAAPASSAPITRSEPLCTQVWDVSLQLTGLTRSSGLAAFTEPVEAQPEF